jgi:hypothetical protein
VTATTLPTFDSLGIRLFATLALPDLAHDLLVGTLDSGATESATTLRPLSRALQRDGLDRVLVLDPADDSVRARFTVDDGCAGCCAMNTERLLLIEGRALVSRAIDGSDRRAHARLTLGPGESVVRALQCADGRAVVCTSADEAYENNTVRVYDLGTGACVQTIELAAQCDIAWIVGGSLVLGLRDWDLVRFELRAIALATGQQAWSQTFDVDGPRGVARAFHSARGADVVIVETEDGPRTVDLATGATEPFARTAIVALDRAQALCDTQDTGLEARSLVDGALRARFATFLRCDHGAALGDGRFAVLLEDTLVLCDGSGSGCVAGAALSLAANEGGATLTARARWISIERVDRSGFYVAPGAPPPDLSRGVSFAPLERARAPRAIPSLVERAPREIALPTALRSVNDAALERDPPVDELRLDEILAVLDEERGVAAAAWERLVARGLVSAGCELDDHPVYSSTQSDAPVRPGAVDSERALGLWVALAHDAPAIETALALARELIERLSPWRRADARGATRVCFNADPWMRHTALDPLLARVDASLLSVVRYAVNDMGGPAVRWLLARDALWNDASAAGDVLPPTAPERVAGKPFREVPSPYAPAIALVELGFAAVTIQDDAVELALAGFDETLRAREPSEDVPF